MTSDDLRHMALLLPGAVEKSHFGKADFRVGNKIFTSLKNDLNGVLKLTPEQQSVMAEAEPQIFQAIPGGWGRKGWTNIILSNADALTMESALRMAWRNVAPKSSHS